MKRVWTDVAKIGALVAGILIGPVTASAQDSSRGVRIIDGPDAPSPPSAPQPPTSIAPAPTQPTPKPLVTAPGPTPGPLPPLLATPGPTLMPLEPPGPAELATPTPNLAPPAAPPAPPAQIVAPGPAPAPPKSAPSPSQLATPTVAPLVPPTSSLAPLMPPPSSLPPLVAPAPVPDLATIAPTPSPSSIAPAATTPAAPSTYDTSSLPPAPGGLTQPAPPVSLPTLDGTIPVSNPAELSVDILPGSDIKVGSRVRFRITTKKPGYLILVDVDSSGKLTQIFPNPMSLLTATSDRANPHANFIKPGAPIHLPDPKSALTGGYEFVASPPLGTAMVVAILSDRPVQLIDLPDVPTSLVGQAAALAYLNKVANELRVPPAIGSGPLLEPKWSLDAKFYAIQ